MNDQGQPEDQLKKEFAELGSNLRSLIQGAWESEQRKNASQEVQRGLNEVGEALSRAAAEFSEGPAANKSQLCGFTRNSARKRTVRP